MSNRRKRRPNRKPSARRRPRQARSARQLRKPQSPHALGPDANRMIWLSMALGAGMAYATLHVPEPDGAVLTTILDVARNFEIVSKSADPGRRTWDAILQLEELDAMVTQPTAAA